jgi:hypothetical protein
MIFIGCLILGITRSQAFLLKKGCPVHSLLMAAKLSEMFVFKYLLIYFNMYMPSPSLALTHVLYFHTRKVKPAK